MHSADEKEDPVLIELERIARSAGFARKRLESRLVDNYRRRNQDTLISIVMPTWNRKHVIKRAIDSVMVQTYRHFELIVSDDGSTDGTREFVSCTYGTSPRILYLLNPHRGVSYARNSALEQAKGAFVAYLDSDNEWGPNYLLIMINSLKDSPGKSCAYCGITIIDDIRKSRFTRLIDYDRASLIARNYIDMNIFIHHKALCERYGGFEHDLEPLEDWELILRYTLDNPPLVVNCSLANYYISGQLNHQTVVCPAASSFDKIRARHRD